MKNLMSNHSSIFKATEKCKHTSKDNFLDPNVNLDRLKNFEDEHDQMERFIY